MEKVMSTKAKMLGSLFCVTILGRVMADEFLVNRHFKGDMFSKQGE